MKIDIFEDMKERVGCDSISKRTVRKVFPLCIWCRLCCYNGNTGNEERK